MARILSALFLLQAYKPYGTLRSAPLEIRSALLDVGRDTFFGILALEQKLLQFALNCQRLRERNFRSRLYRTLDTSHRLRGFIGRAEAARKLHDALPVAFRLVDIVHQSQLLGFLEADQLALDHQFDGLIFGQRPRQALRAACAGQYAQIDFRQANLARAAPCDADVAGQGNLQPTSNGMPVERGNHQLGRLLQTGERLVSVQAEIILERRRHRIKHADLGARAEELLACPAHDQDMNVLIKTSLQYSLIELAHHLIAVGIGRGID